MSQPNNPLHGVTLEHIVTALVAHFGWPALAQQIDINCFKGRSLGKKQPEIFAQNALGKRKGRTAVCGQKAVPAILRQLLPVHLTPLVNHDNLLTVRVCLTLIV